ncbi:hypothetical protein PLESTM_000173200 [Pleodorina starrii]|nr:hypothetical protein PLESTM_000173200 [Pleodorina starrii]
MALRRFLKRLLVVGLLCATHSPAAHGRLAAAAFTLALSPALVAEIPGGRIRTAPHTAPLLHALLDSLEGPTAAEHWQGSHESLQALQELIRSGRALLLTPPDADPQLPQGVSSWLASAERTVAALPAGPSYPQLRRAVVALLVEVWLVAGASWSQSYDNAATRILLKLYDLHAASSVRKSVVEYYHFSKAAGTSVCVTSAAMGCTTFSVTEQYTCLVPEFVDGPRWMSRKAHNSRCRRTLPGYSQCLTKLYTKLARWGQRYSPRSALVGCSERAAWLSDRGFNFYASEYTLRGRGGNVSDAPALCSGFLNLAVLRAPQARLLSHMRYIVRITYDWLGERTAQYLRNMTLYDWQRLVPAAFDNYYIRSLLGEAAFYARTGELNATEHLPAARAVLGAMDVLLVLEDSERLLELGHRWGLGWRKTFLQAEGRISSRASGEVIQIAERVVPNGAAAEELAAANHLDEQLYEYAVRLSRLDAVVWAVAEAAGVVPPATETAAAAATATAHVEDDRTGAVGGVVPVPVPAPERGPCGYVAPVWPRPSAPPLPPNASGCIPPSPAPH